MNAHPRTPVVTDMTVVPVAGHDSMLLNLSGAHAPFFTRNLVVLTDCDGHTGVGEVPGGEKIRRTLEEARPLVVGAQHRRLHARARRIAGRVRRPRRGRAWSADLRSADHGPRGDRRGGGPARPAGPDLEVPVAALLGDGQQRDAVEMLGYLFYVGDRTKTDLPTGRRRRGRGGDEWLRLRHEEALTPAGRRAAGRGGPRALRLQRLQAEGRRAAAATRRSRPSRRWHERFPDARITLDPNGAWPLEEAIRPCRGLRRRAGLRRRPVRRRRTGSRAAR